MIDANDAYTIDWTNPTIHMLAGKKAGEAESAERIKELESIIVKLEGDRTRHEKRIAELESDNALNHAIRQRDEALTKLNAIYAAKDEYDSACLIIFTGDELSDTNKLRAETELREVFHNTIREQREQT